MRARSGLSTSLALSHRLTTIGTLILFISAAPAGSAAPSFQGLGELPGGDSFSYALALSLDGSTVVGYSDSDRGHEAFRWTEEGGMAGLGSLPGQHFESAAVDVSADGSILVGCSTPDGLNPRAVRWTGPDQIALLENLPYYSIAMAVSADGSVVAVNGGLGVYRYVNGDVQLLGSPPGQPYLAQAFGISADGRTIVGGAGATAFRWNPENGMMDMGCLPGGSQGSYANAASSDGSVIVGRSDSANWAEEAFRWTLADGMMPLGTLPGVTEWYSDAMVVSEDGSLILGVYWSDIDRGAFIWDAGHGLRKLQQVLEDEYGLALNGWRLGNVTGISADRLTIVGNGTNPQGQTEAWIAHIPEPSTLLLWALGGLLLSRRPS